jgi:8-oxo-dGTP pyrophosphatase MutT (NUDIX family)
MAAVPLADLAAMADAELRTLIRARVRPLGRSGDDDDWRLGAVLSDDRAELREHFARDPVPAAVLVPLVERAAGLTVLLTQRASALKNHGGQISFPGGRIEDTDADAASAALREAREEIGLEESRVEVVGRLPDHLIVSGYRVTPVVGFVRAPFELHLDSSEVDEAFEVPLAFLLDPRNHVPRRRQFGGVTVNLIDMPYGDRNIWGATAGMLRTFYRVLLGEDA